VPLPARSRDVTGLPGAPAYDGPMQPGVLGQASGPVPGPGLLVPGPLRRRAVALLAACVAVTVVLGVRFAGYGLPDWLDLTFDPRIQARLARFPALLNRLADVGTLGPVAVMTLALVLACAVARRWLGAALAVAAVPVATGLTEYVLKPTVGEAIGQSFPSGHATSMFALAATCAVLLAGPPGGRVPGGARLLLALLAIGLAAAVAVAMVAIGAHAFTDAIGGAAVGTAVVLACALALDLLASAVGARPRGPALR
jgi:membrane-associated phospholipid phosphatase